MRQPLARLPDRLTDEVTDAISWLTEFKDKFCAIDIETSGVDAFTSQIYLVSVADSERVVVFDWRELWPDEEFQSAFKEFLTTADLVAHNSLFEQSFFLAQVGVQANIVADTMIMHQILTAGLPDKSSLETLYQKYFGIPLDKKWQKYFLNLKPDETIDPDAIAYSTGDVVKLVELARILEGELEREGLLHIWTDIEKPFLPIVAQAKHRGISVDENVLFELKGELEFAQYKALRNFGKLTGDKPSMDGKLLLRTVPKLNINSADQLLNLFRSLGCDVEKTDEETLKYLTQKARKEVRAIAQSVLDYRQVTKVLGTYVIPLLKEHRNERTGRIHPDWKQCSTDTGRMACANPNMQNLPSKGPYARIREAFVAEPGHKLIVADYSQMELRVLAELSGEPKLIEAFQNGEDLHSKTAALLFGPEYTKEQRSIAKIFNFGIAYGAGPAALSQQTETNYRTTEQLYYKFFDGYPVLKEYLDQSAQYAKDHLCCKTPAGRKRFFTAVTDEGSDRIRKLAAIGREGTNGPIQGCNADVTKLASILFVRAVSQYQDLLGYGYCRLLMFVHDELVATAEDQYAEEYSRILHGCMIEAGQRYLKSVPVEVSLTIGDRWTK